VPDKLIKSKSILTFKLKLSTPNKLISQPFLCSFYFSLYSFYLTWHIVKDKAYSFTKYRIYYFQFGSIFIKNNNQIVFLLKQTEIELEPIQTDRFGYFGIKTGSNWFGSVFAVWLGFFLFDSVFFRFGTV
jgi:hypothetical protein